MEGISSASLGMASPASRRRRVAEKWLFAGTALVVGTLIVVGFAKTWFLRELYSPREALTLVVKAHGALMSLWMVLFVVQIGLAAGGRIELHRKLGRIGPWLLVLITLASVPMTLIAARLGGSHMPGPAKPALALVGGFLVSFVGVAGVGLYFKQRPDVHKRLMLVAMVIAMEAAISRLPLDFLDSLFRTHLANDLLLVLVIAIDTVVHRRVHPAFLWGGLFVVAMQCFTAWVANTHAWLQLAQQVIAAVN